MLSPKIETPYIRWHHFLPVGQRILIEQSPVDRKWMDETEGRYSYRCLPLTYASRHGWAIRAPEDVVVAWDGKSNAEILSGAMTEHGAVFADTNTGNGIVTFHVNAIPRTPADYNLWLMGGPNLVIPGASPLSAIVESDWTFASPTMNWKLTDPGREVVFKKGDPVFFFVPIHKTYLEGFELQHVDIQDSPEMLQRYNDHLNWRQGLGEDESVFGKRYMRGLNPDGTVPDWDHNHMTRLVLSESDSNSSIIRCPHVGDAPTL